MVKLSVTQRRWLLTIHLLFSAILFGVSMVFLVLSIVAANTQDEGVLQACYASMHILAKTSVRASTIGTLATGILLSALTRWGLFNHYWLIAKEALTVLSILLGPVGMYFWTLKAFTWTSSKGFGALQDPAFLVNREQLWIGIGLQILSLAAVFAISVFKPWGTRTKKGS
ncbi:MAG: hypothetical protein ACOYEF_10975 [Planifilum sp.]|jgi:hypothetical protein